MATTAVAAGDTINEYCAVNPADKVNPQYFTIYQGKKVGFCCPDCKEAFDKDPNLVNLLLDPFFTDAVTKAEASWRRVIAAAVTLGIPVPALSSALAYYDGYRCERLPANLLQAQRDYFGAHTYERVDKPAGQFFHTNWTGRGGTTSASTYIV